MLDRKFLALVVSKSEKGGFVRSVKERNLSALPNNEVLIRVHYSSLNYKDVLSCLGNPGVTRHYPHTPGIDAAGIVVSSASIDFKAGDSVVVISHDLGMNTPGGFGQYVSVPASWVMPLPQGLSLRESMIFGTAGFTAALSVLSLTNQEIKPSSGPIVVTGATGGVGCISVCFLAKLGYQVIASTGKTDATKFLSEIGASEVINRKLLNDTTGRNLLEPVWAGAIDTVGGNTLSTLLKGCKPSGVVVATGMVESQTFHSTVLPFILRGIKLIGINAEGADMNLRKETWLKIYEKLMPLALDRFSTECKLEDLNSEIDRMLQGRHMGRIIVDLR